MLPKSCFMFTLIVAIQFSQIFAAPRDDLGQLTVSDADDGIPKQPMQDLIKESMGEQVADSVPSVNEETAPVEEDPEEHLSHMLTGEQELRLLHEVPEFTQIIRAMETLPDGVYDELKSFLTSTVPRMPEENLFTKHFQNTDLLVQLFERLIKVARTEGAVYQPSSKALFNRIHKAAPEIKTEMDQFDGLMELAKSRLGNLGTSTNPMNSMDQKSGVDVAAGSVSLPIENKSERFYDEFAPAAVSTE